MKAAIYARISDDREGDQLGVKRQLADCRKLAGRKGWTVADEYVDNDVSAYKRKVRREYRRMLADIEAGVVEAVVVYHLDRLHRQPRELEEFVGLCDKAGVSNVATVTGDVNLASGDGLLIARIQGAVAANESNAKSRRIKRKALELAEAGKVAGGGTRPYGFEDDRRTIRASEAAMIREAARRVLAGDTVRSLCVEFNDRKILTSTGRQWVPQVMTRMLKSARISGRREHHGEVVADAEWPAIISAGDGDRLRSILSDPARRKNGRARRYLLAGMLRCGRCGEPLDSRPRDDGRRRYVCAKRPGSDACGKLAIVADELEALVAEMVIFRFEGPALAKAIAAQAGVSEGDHQQEVDTAVEQLEELARAYGERKITVSEWMAARAPIEQRLEAAKAALARSSGTMAVSEYVGDIEALRGSWEGMTLSRKRAVISTLLEHVVIKAGRPGFNRFDAGRVEPVWRI